jgi:DNA-binding transcriptional ArsR family regulator
MAALFKVMGNTTRLRLIAQLSHEERCVEDLVEGLGMSQSAVSHQLRVLRESNIVDHRRDGRHVRYRLVDHHVRELYDAAAEHVDE